MLKLPYIQEFSEITSKYVQSCINAAKMDWDSYETSWDFQRHPLLRSVSRLADAYAAWKAECGERFQQLKKNEEELNRIFIDIYGLQDELTPEVADRDVTVHRIFDTKDDVPESMQGSNYVRAKRDEIVSLLSYAVGCMFGRYSLDEEGLILAGQPLNSHFYEGQSPRSGTGVAGAPGMNVPNGQFYYKVDGDLKKCTFNPDHDGILPITDEEYLEDDIISRLCGWLKAVYGADTLEENLDFIAGALGGKGNSSREIIRNYFLKDLSEASDLLAVRQRQAERL